MRYVCPNVSQHQRELGKVHWLAIGQPGLDMRGTGCWPGRFDRLLQKKTPKLSLGGSCCLALYQLLGQRYLNAVS